MPGETSIAGVADQHRRQMTDRAGRRVSLPAPRNVRRGDDVVPPTMPARRHYVLRLARRARRSRRRREGFMLAPPQRPCDQLSDVISEACHGLVRLLRRLTHPQAPNAQLNRRAVAYKDNRTAGGASG